MAKSKVKGKAVAADKPSKQRRQTRSDSDLSEDDDFVGEPGTMADVKRGPVSKKQKTARTEEEEEKAIHAKWVKGLRTRNCINERQVDAGSLGEDYSVPQIRREGLQSWFDPLDGYNLKLVKEFYQGMERMIGSDTGDLLTIESKVGNKRIIITPKEIAEQLRYERPDPSTVNYPRAKPFDADFVKSVLYSHPSHATTPVKPSRFTESIRILNLAIHANLYPRGTENKPSQKSVELMVAFMDPNTKVDWAHFIFTQISDYYDNMVPEIRMWFPCLINGICKKQGVKGSAYATMEKLSPGPIGLTSLEKSNSQSKHAGAADPSSSSRTPSSLRSMTDLYTPPSKGSTAITWLKKVFKCQVVGLKKQAKIDKKMDWLIQQHEASSSARFVPSPDDEDDKDDE